MTSDWHSPYSASPCYTIDDLVVVSHVNTFENFFVQRCVDLPALLDIQCRLDQADEARTLVRIDSAQECCSSLILARYSLDEKLYRAQVRKVKGEKCLSVYFIDFGNDEIVSLQDCYLIPDDFLTVPDVAIACAIFGLFGTRGKSEEATAVFEKLVDAKEVLMEVLGCEPERVMVDLLIMERPEGWHSFRIGANSLAYCYPGMNSVRTCLLMSNLGVLCTDLPRKIHFAKIVNLQQLTPGSIHFARISAMESPSRFSLQFLGTGDRSGRDIKRLLKGMRATYTPCLLNLMHRVFEPRIGDFVAVHSKDSGGRFLRAQVEAVPKRLLVSVRFLDSGLRDTVELSDVFRLQPEFLELPFQAVDVILHGVTSPDTTGDDKWPEPAYTLLKRYADKEYVRVLVHQAVVVKILSPGDAREFMAVAFQEGELPKFALEVSIFHPKTGESLGDNMIRKKLAKLLG